MRDNVFLDSSVLIYLIDQDQEKKTKALNLLHDEPFISTQVINEISNVMRKKFMEYSDIFEIVQKISEKCKVAVVDQSQIYVAYYIAGKYQYSYYDSLIISSALENDCNKLYSEDMQNNQVLEKKLTIRNPFL